MEQSPKLSSILELIDKPTFCVCDGVVVQANSAAREKQITVGATIENLLKQSDLNAYSAFENGCLAVTVNCCGIEYMAAVTRAEECDIFRIEQDPVAPELKALSVAAQHIRIPLATAITVSDQLLSQTDSRDQNKAAQLNKALYQLHRLICNISDTARYADIRSVNLETVNISAVFNEVFEKASTFLENADIHVHYTGLDVPVIGLADTEKLSRAIYNILSNAVKFSPDSNTIDAKLTRNGNMLHFTVQDNGPGIPREIMTNVFSRFLRQPSIEDGRNGIGLGIPLVHSVAASHGGTLLIDHPEGHGTRFTMTIQIRTNDSTTLRAPILPIGDYAGGRDMALLELSEILPAELYRDDI